jgi:hypothetical protein
MVGQKCKKQTYPESVDSPAVRGTNDGVGIPELRLQQGTARSIEAAQVGLHGGVVAGQLAGGRAGHCSSWLKLERDALTSKPRSRGPELRARLSNSTQRGQRQEAQDDA